MQTTTTIDRPNTTEQKLRELSPSSRRLVHDLTDHLLATERSQGLTPPPPQPDDLRPYIPDWLGALAVQGKSRHTLKNFRLNITWLLAQFPAPTPAQLDAYLATRQAGGLSPSTMYNTVCAIKNFFNYLSRIEALPSNPAHRLQLPPRPKRERRPPPPDHLHQLLHSPRLTHRDRTVLYLLIDCGLRIDELCTARLSDVDLQAATITVIGKGNKQRTNPISTPTVIALQNHLHRLPADTPWLFRGRPTSHHITDNPLRDRIRRLCKAAGIPYFSPHQLRHFAATAMLTSGASLKVVSELLGHADTSITANVYWHVLDADEARRQHATHNPLAQVLENRR